PRVEQPAEPLVGLAWRAEPGVLPHDPRLRLGGNPSGEGELARPLRPLRRVVDAELRVVGGHASASWSSCSRSTFFAILPVELSGNASTTRTSLGFLYDASRSRQCSRTASTSTVRPGAAVTSATTRCPQSASRTPTTATSATPGTSATTSSTSRG